MKTEVFYSILGNCAKITFSIWPHKYHSRISAVTTERAPRFGGGALLSFPALQDLRCYFHALLFQHLTFLTPNSVRTFIGSLHCSSPAVMDLLSALDCLPERAGGQGAFFSLHAVSVSFALLIANCKPSIMFFSQYRHYDLFWNIHTKGSCFRNCFRKKDMIIGIF